MRQAEFRLCGRPAGHHALVRILRAIHHERRSCPGRETQRELGEVRGEPTERDLAPERDRAARAEKESPSLRKTDSPQPAVKAVPGMPARVTRVLDGDTIEVLPGGRSLDVWLIGVDAPETLRRRSIPRCWWSATDRPRPDSRPRGCPARRCSWSSTWSAPTGTGGRSHTCGGGAGCSTARVTGPDPYGLDSDDDGVAC